MFNWLSKLGLPVPSKTEIVMFVLIVISVMFNFYQRNTLKVKEEIIKRLDLEISIQKETTLALQNKFEETSANLENTNDLLNDIEKDYQRQINELLEDAGKCSSNEAVSEFEEKAQSKFNDILTNLANSTRKE